MHEFDGSGELDVAGAAIGAKAGGRERQHRPQPFAARGNQMVGDFRNHRHMRCGARQNRLVDALHIGGDETDEGFDTPFRRGFFQRDDDAQAFQPPTNALILRDKGCTINAPKVGRAHTCASKPWEAFCRKLGRSRRACNSGPESLGAAGHFAQ